MNEERVSWANILLSSEEYRMFLREQSQQLAYTFASLFSKGLAFITVPIFTRIMSTDELVQ